MPINEGTLDRVIRVVAGLAIISLVFIGPKTPWAWLGLVPRQHSTSGKQRLRATTKMGELPCGAC